jgi:hypothetical protein
MHIVAHGNIYTLYERMALPLYTLYTAGHRCAYSMQLAPSHEGPCPCPFDANLYMMRLHCVNQGGGQAATRFPPSMRPVPQACLWQSTRRGQKKPHRREVLPKAKGRPAAPASSAGKICAQLSSCPARCTTCPVSLGAGLQCLALQVPTCVQVRSAHVPGLKNCLRRLLPVIHLLCLRRA